jgi:uncharacterized damage-inducible protein DinB
MGGVMAERAWIDEVALAWRTNHRITLLLLDAVGDEGMLATLSTRGGRTVGRQFAHLQYVRVLQLRTRAKPLSKGAAEIATDEEPDRAALRAALEDSAARVEEWLRRAAAGEKGVRPFRKGVAATLAYLVSHEAHHRGNILLTLKQRGHPVAQELRYRIWDWDRI